MRLERLLVAVVVLVSGVVAVGATGVQLYAEYRQARDRLDAGVREVTASFIEPLTEAVWVGDQALIDATLAGLRELPGVVLAEVRTPAEAAAVGSAGPLPPRQSERALPLERVYREQTIPLGTLVVRTSFADVIDRLVDRLVIILLTNFGKTLFVSIIMLLVFRRLVTRHLLRIARHVHAIDPGRPPEHLALPGRRPAEELAEVADAIKLLEARIHTQLRGEGDLRRELEQRLAELRALDRQNRRLNNTLDEQLRELERVNQDLERFGYSLSHDFRRSIRTIGSFSEILLEDTGSLDEERRHMLARIGVATDRMSHIVDAMLELHRLGTGAVSRQAVAVGRLARSIARELQEEAPDRAVEWQLPDDALEDADEGLLMLALQNLLGNAFKFTGRRPRAEIELGRQRLADGRWEWFVRDNGVGFDMQAAARVFEPFQRLHDEHAFPGTGVGLATVAQVIRRHGGTIRAEGSPDDGAAFYFTLRPVPAPHITPTPLAATADVPG